MSATTTPQAGQTTTPTTRITITTPSRRALSADPPTTLRLSVRTPGSTARTRGLSASVRRRGTAAQPLATTPHGRAAVRALDSRRAALFTPGARRRSIRDQQRDTPRDPLRALSRILAPRSTAVPSSSSPGGGGGSDPTGTIFIDEDDDEEERPLRVPRLSLPIDDEDDGDLPRPHRSAGLEDENFTMQSIELPRRAISEQPPGRFSLGGGRVSDVYAQLDHQGWGLRSDDVGVDSAFFPPLHAIDEDDAAVAAGLAEEDVGYEMFEAEDTRRVTGRESDFGLVIPPPPDNESLFEIQHEVENERSPGSENELFGMEESHVHFADDTIGGQEEDEPDGGDLEEEPEDEELETENDAAPADHAAASGKARKKKAGVKTSKYGIQYPSLPPAVVKRLAQTFAKTSGVKGKIGPDTLAAIMQASDWFFEQLGDDLQAYARHAGRKTIEESDVLQIMRRQRQTNASTTPFSLAQRYLPRELLQELRMPPPAPAKKSRRAKGRGGDADDEVT